MKLTWLDSNSWLFKLGGKHILLDPWLVGPLTFGSQPWFFKAERQQPIEMPRKIDLILLSQGLPDHAHPPTLEVLDRNIPVVASPNAAKVVEELGFNEIHSLNHGESFQLGKKLEIKALPGSLVGPSLVENGYWLKALKSGETLYYEPHGFHDSKLQSLAPVDVVIAPVVNLSLLGFVPVIKGMKSAVEVCQTLQPQVILPTANGAALDYSGLLMAIAQIKGSAESCQRLLAEKGLSTEVLQPTPGEPLSLKFRRRATTA